MKIPSPLDVLKGAFNLIAGFAVGGGGVESDKAYAVIDGSDRETRRLIMHDLFLIMSDNYWNISDCEDINNAVYDVLMFLSKNQGNQYEVLEKCMFVFNELKESCEVFQQGWAKYCDDAQKGDKAEFLQITYSDSVEAEDVTPQEFLNLWADDAIYACWIYALKTSLHGSIADIDLFIINILQSMNIAEEVDPGNLNKDQVNLVCMFYDRIACYADGNRPEPLEMKFWEEGAA